MIVGNNNSTRLHLKEFTLKTLVSLNASISMVTLSIKFIIRKALYSFQESVRSYAD